MTPTDQLIKALATLEIRTKPTGDPGRLAWFTLDNRYLGDYSITEGLALLKLLTSEEIKRRRHDDL